MQELLKFQNIDAELRKVSAGLFSSQNRKKANEMQQYLKDIQNKLFSLDENAGLVASQVEKVKQEYNDIVLKIENVLKANAASSEELERSENEVVRLSERLSKIEKDLNNLQTKLVLINKDFEALMKNAKTARGNLNYYKQEYNKQKAQFEPQIEKLKAELEEQKKKVKPELLQKYYAKAEGKIFPIFVPLKDNRCGGCRMEVPAGKIKDLQTKKIIECENCGRIIYLP